MKQPNNTIGTLKLTPLEMYNDLWWGYRHVNGHTQAKRYFTAEDIKEAVMSPFVKWVTPEPFYAKDRDDAIRKVKEQYKPFETK